MPPVSDPAGTGRRDPSREPLSATAPAPVRSRPTVGVLASQGDFAAHAAMLEALGAEPRKIRSPLELEQVDALVIPGGESTAILKAIERDGLEPAIRAHVERGRPVLGTCAGMIVLDRERLGLLDVSCRRNAFGRQLQSFEADLEIEGLGAEPLRCVFIRAPWVEEHGPGVEVLAGWEGHPVAVREGAVLACAFHPELTDDPRLHALFMSMIPAEARDPRANASTSEEER